jgi:hypothetical protein
MKNQSITVEFYYTGEGIVQEDRNHAERVLKYFAAKGMRDEVPDFAAVERALPDDIQGCCTNRSAEVPLCNVFKTAKHLLSAMAHLQKTRAENSAVTLNIRCDGSPYCSV